MNKATRELLDRKKEENRLIEENRLKNKLIKQTRENKKLSKNVEKESFKTIEKEKAIKTITKKIKKENIVNKKDEKTIIQDNYIELKKQSDLTEKFIRLADKLDIDDTKFPKTEKGMSTKAKEIMEKLAKKLEKEEKKNK